MIQPTSSTSSLCHGFSLIELMITVTIAGILIAVAVPSLVSLIRDSRLSTHTDLLVNSLNTARLEAVRQRRDYQVCPSTAPDTAMACSVGVADWASGWIINDGAADVVQRIQAKTGITLTTAAIAVTFRGTLGSSTAVATTSFTLCTPGSRQQQIDISPSGHISKRINATCI